MHQESTSSGRNGRPILLPWAGVLALAALGSAGWLFHASLREMSHAAAVVTHTHQVLTELEGAKAGLRAAESARRAYALTGDVDERGRIEGHIAEAAHHLRKARALVDGNARQQARFDVLDPLVAERATQLRKAVERGPDTPGEKTLIREGIELTQRIVAEIEDAGETERTLLAMREADVRHHVGQTRVVALGGLALGGLLLAVVVLLLRRQIAQRARSEESLSAMVEKLAGSQATLADQTQLLQSMIDSMSEGVVVADEKGRFVQFNPAAERILGRQAVEATPSGWSMQYGIFLSDGRPCPSEELPLSRAIRGLETNDVELLVRNPNVPEGALILANGRPHRDGQGRLRGGIVVFRDVTASTRARERHLREIAALGELGELLQACHTVEEAHQILVAKVSALFPGYAGSIAMLRASRNVLETKVQWGVRPAAPPEGFFATEDCWALRRGQMHLVAETAGAATCRHLGPGPARSVCLPLGAEGDMLGVFSLVAETPDARLDADLQRLLSAVVRHTGTSLGNLRLREILKNQSIRDALTGLYNRRFLEEFLERESFRAARSRSSFGVVLIDVDHFKRFNDSHGHEAGDAVLRAIGESLASGIRGGDVACRYGGEELVVVLPGASLEAACARAEALRERVKALRIAPRGELLGPVTISLGVAAYPDHGATAQEIVAAADRALYRAKREGRDRVQAAPTATAAGEGSPANPRSATP